MELQSLADSARAPAPRNAAAAWSPTQMRSLALSPGSTGRTRQGHPPQARLGSAGWSEFLPAVAG